MATVAEMLKGIGQPGATAERRPPLIVTPTRLQGFNDNIMKIGGLAGGRVYEFYAPPSAGKSTLKQIFYADYQKQGKIAVDFDVESASQTATNLDERVGWMENLGVDIKNLIMPNFGAAEELFEQVKKLIVLGANIIGIDTVAVLQPQALIEREEEDANMRERLSLATALTGFFNGVVGGFSVRDGKSFIPVPDETVRYLKNYGVTITDKKVHKLWYYDCALIGINHAKDMIGVMYGDPTTTPGGKALPFHSSVRFGGTKPTKSKDKVKLPNGQEVSLYRKSTWTAAKNKLASPFGEMTLRVYQDGRVQEDIPYYVAAEKKGLIAVGSRTITILEGEHNGLTMKKADFETWVADNDEFLAMVDETVEAMEVVEAPKPKVTLSFGKPAVVMPQIEVKPKFSLNVIKKQD